MDAVGGGDMNLGELADLTVANDNDLSMDVITPLFWNNAWVYFAPRSHGSTNAVCPVRCKTTGRSSRRRGTLVLRYAATSTPSAR